MKTTIIALIVMVTFNTFSQQKSRTRPEPFSVKGKTVAVYTTADSTRLRHLALN